MTVTPDSDVTGGTDLGTQVVKGLAPLAKVVDALDQQTTILANIQASLTGDVQRQPTASQRSAIVGQTRTAPKPGGTPTVVTDTGTGPGNLGAGQTTADTLTTPAAPAAPAAPAQGEQAPGPEQPPGRLERFKTMWKAPVPSRTAAGPPSGGGGGGGEGGDDGGPPAGTPSSEDDSGDGLASGRQQAHMAAGGGSGLSSRLYNKAVGQFPLLSVPKSLINEYQSQINKNNWYKRMGGADSWQQAVGSRIHEEIVKLPGFGYGKNWSSAEAAGVFKETRALGYSPDSARLRGGMTQHDVMDFMYQGKKQYGATPDEMFQYVQTINKNAALGTGSLKQFNDQMEQLTKTAADSGVAMDVVNRHFKDLFETNTQAGVGANAPGLAFAQTSGLTQLGPAFQNQTPNLMGPEGMNQRYTLAAQMGMSPTDLSAAMKTSQGAYEVQKGSSQQFVQRMQSMIPAQGWSWLEAQVNQNQKELQQDPSTTSTRIAQQFWSDRSLYGGLNGDAFLQLANAFAPEAVTFGSPEEATARLVVEMAGLGDYRKTAEQAVASGEFNTKTGKSTTPGQTRVTASQGMKTLEDIHGGGEATDAYKAQVAKSGTGSGIILEALRIKSSDEQKDSKWQVSTKDGYRVVSMKEAVTKFSGQVESGEAKEIGSGDTAADISGMSLDTSKGAKKRAQREEGQTSVGEDYDAYRKDHADEFDKGKGGVTGLKGIIDLDPGVKRWFVINGVDQVDPTQPAANDNLNSGLKSPRLPSPYSNTGGW